MGLLVGLNDGAVRQNDFKLNDIIASEPLFWRKE